MWVEQTVNQMLYEGVRDLSSHYRLQNKETKKHVLVAERGHLVMSR